MASLKDSFHTHSMNNDQIDRINRLREAYLNLAEMLKELTPNSRESSLAMTRLEESSMWAIKSISLERCEYN